MTTFIHELFPLKKILVTCIAKKMKKNRVRLLLKKEITKT